MAPTSETEIALGNQGLGQSVGLLPIGDKKRKQIAASGGGNESSGWGGANQGIIGG